MSLQIWLPLNGDLHNQGLHGESIFTTNNAISNDNGKIGKCYSFNGTDSYLITDFTPGTIVPNEMSFCCWVKLNIINKTHTLFCSRKATGAGLSFFILSDSHKLRFDNGNDKKNSTYQTTFDYIFAANVWYHIAVIQTNTQKKLYINGILQQSINKASANLGNNTATKGSIGASGSNDASGNYLDGYLNDVRIYDHALSDKEVEEIAKGLILHYKLDGTSCPNKNLFKLNNIDNYWNIYKPSDYLAYGLALTEKLELNQPYTIQLWDVDVSHNGKTEAQLGLGIYLGGAYNQLHTWLGPQYFTNGHADYLSITFTKTSWSRPAHAQNLWLNIYNSPGDATGTRYMHIGAWKIEKGEVPTSWNGEENIVYDSSGYNNDGTIVGSLSAVADSTRYNCATYFANGVNDHIVIDSTNFPKDNITMSIWFKTSNITPTGHHHWLFGRYLDYQMSIRDSNGYLYVGYHINDERKYKEISINLIDGLWHMVTSTYDGNNIKIYVDGQLKQSITATGMLSSVPDLYIGTQNNGAYGVKECSLSDARIYATALTEAQVKELYNTSATIDNLGNIYAREFEETSNELNITKSGIFKNNSIIDNNNYTNASIMNNKELLAKTLYEY